MHTWAADIQICGTISGGHLEFPIDKQSTETLKRTMQGTSLPSLVPNDLVVSEISEKI
jgi:hypothetical protein